MRGGKLSGVGNRTEVLGGGFVNSKLLFSPYTRQAANSVHFLFSLPNLERPDSSRDTYHGGILVI